MGWDYEYRPRVCITVRTHPSLWRSLTLGLHILPPSFRFFVDCSWSALSGAPSAGCGRQARDRLEVLEGKPGCTRSPPRPESNSGALLHRGRNAKTRTSRWPQPTPINSGKTRAGEAARQLGVLAAPAEGWNWVPSTHMVTHNHLELHFLGMRCPFLASAGT